MTSPVLFRSFAVIDALRAPDSFVARAARLVLEKYPMWEDLAIVRVKPRPQVTFKITSPADKQNKLVLEIGPGQDATLVFGPWHTHANVAFPAGASGDARAEWMMKDIFVSIEGILDGTTLAVQEGIRGHWGRSYLAGRDYLPTPIGGSLRVTSWLGQANTELVAQG